MQNLLRLRQLSFSVNKLQIQMFTNKPYYQPISWDGMHLSLTILIGRSKKTKFNEKRGVSVTRVELNNTNTIDNINFYYY